MRDRISHLLDDEKAKITAEYLCKTGELLLVTDKERYIRKEDFTFPCIKTDNNDRVYVIKTLLTKDMEVKPY